MSEVSPSIPGTSARESTCGSAHPRVSEPGLGRRDACAAAAAAAAGGGRGVDMNRR